MDLQEYPVTRLFRRFHTSAFFLLVNTSNKLFNKLCNKVNSPAGDQSRTHSEIHSGGHIDLHIVNTSLRILCSLHRPFVVLDARLSVRPGQFGAQVGPLGGSGG